MGGTPRRHRTGAAARPAAAADRAGRAPAGHGLRRLRPLAEVVRAGHLAVAEAVVLVAALAPEVDPRFDALFGCLADRPDQPWLTGEVARTLAARTLTGRLRAADLLAPTATLRAAGLLDLEPSPLSAYAGRLRPDPDLVRWVLGRPAEPPRPGPGLPARPVSTVYTLDDLVLPAAQRDRLAALVARIRDRRLVVDTWGFGQAHDNVDGLVALFHGPPGTGKSMAAAAVGRAAGLPVWRVDLSALVSKYIGETEKQLARVFDRAARESWLLVFDEADAVFGRRTDVSDAHDRYANQEVSYLLTRVERHPGVVVLTTNLLANIDEAFQRRLHAVVGFTEPGVGERVALWERVVPPQLPVAAGIDRGALARRYNLTGAQIRDATLEAAYLAAANGRVVTEEHLLTGVRRQYEKAGRTLPAPG
ncbi:ATP-binding protein [Phytohabitans suffuscus]|uniref:ATP-binding protein n=1 Tax=Phytohabitans suffuscus TaxID=624315 RepID=UPI0038CD192D